MRYLGAVGWQPRALIGNNAGYEQQGWGQCEVSWCCRLATYSTLLATMQAMNSRTGGQHEVSWGCRLAT